MPVPMMPSVKSQYAPSPANGRSASAASFAVVIVVVPWAWSVAAVVRMMKYMTRFEKNMPTSTSARATRISSSVAPARSSGVSRPCARSSSTSCAACQKKRYGEIVVPRRPTSVAR